MRIRLNGSMIAVAVAAAAVSAVISVFVTEQDRRPGDAAGAHRRGKPNFSGIWQANNEAHWDLQAHEARAGAIMQPGVYPFAYTQVPAAPVVALGAAGGVPGSLGVVQGDGEIPYKPEALAIKKENAANWIDRDPELKCYLPGIPRAMYMPYPFEITQSTNKVHMAYAFASTARTVHLDKVDEPPAETWMGHSVGRWEGDTLVVDVTSFNDKTWFDRAGNFHSDALHLVERFTLLTPDVIQYEVTDRGSQRLYAPVADRDAALPPHGAEHAAPRIPLHRIRRGVPLRRRAQGAAGQALGGRNDNRRHHAQGAARRSLPRVVQKVGPVAARAFTRAIARSAPERRNPMRTRLALMFGGLGLVLAGSAVSVSAHHAFAAEFDANKPVNFKGTLNRVEWVNPHVWIHVDVKKPGRHRGEVGGRRGHSERAVPSRASRSSRCRPAWRSSSTDTRRRTAAGGRTGET